MCYVAILSQLLALLTPDYLSDEAESRGGNRLRHSNCQRGGQFLSRSVQLMNGFCFTNKP